MKVEIEQLFGGELEWHRLDSKRACRIRKTVQAGGWRDEARWSEVFPPLVDAMIGLERAMRPHIQRLGIERTAGSARVGPEAS